MKKFMTALTALLTLTVSATAMSYSQARDRALFLTDKMAYELNLTEEQYEAAYEVNLDYLMSINTYDDLYGAYWTNRNLDLSYILLDWQYRAFCAASYFYRPLVWDAGVWRFSVYARYPHRSYFYFGRPTFYATYRGGHGWSMNGGRSWYRGRDFGHGAMARGNGMKDRFDRGDFRGRQTGTLNHGDMRGQGGNSYGRMGNNNSRFGQRNGGMAGTNNRNMGNINRNMDNNQPQRMGSSNRTMGNPDGQTNTQSPRRSTFGGVRNEGRVNRESSTRTTVRPQRMTGTSRNTFSGQSGSTRTLPSRPSNTFTPRSSSSQSVRQMSAPSSVRSTQSRPSFNSGSGMTRGGNNSNGGFGGVHAGGRR